ncbi:MAG: BREX-3 system phosphatase PglZ [Anaerolineales bacterium]|nr:BREX-3 system phosphatase PglZ [Anaerolineales bacterium]
MLKRLLRHFPPHIHALTLVCDPDNVLADEQMLTALAERGFSLILETDPIQLRQVIGQIQFDMAHPIVIITPRPLDQLPYDLWQQGHKVSLQLSEFFPHLAHPIVRQLSPEQRWRLSQVPPPPTRLGEQGTKSYLLQYVFAASLENLKQPAQLIAWLNQYHQQVGKLPPVLAEYWLLILQAAPIYADWPLAELLASREAFQQFVSEQWGAYVQAETGEQVLGETAVRYDVLPFAQDEQLQDTIPALVRAGTLAPVTVTRSERLPVWAKTAVLAPDENANEKRASELLAALTEQSANMEAGRWSQWQQIAQTWAALTNLRYGVGQFSKLFYEEWQVKLDEAFVAWLRGRYGPLGVQRLPVPHHVHHVPYLLAAQREQGQQRQALLVLDGMSLVDWLLIRSRWQARQRNWRMQEQLVLAQIPTVTAVSRQALVSGLRPADFGDSLDHNRQEPKLWRQFWVQRGVGEKGVGYGRIKLGQHDLPTELSSSRIQALCLINTSIDDMLHGASLGAADVQTSLRLWLDKQSPQLETVINDLLQRGFQVTITSDHGHTEAQGMGQPQEGLAVETRSKRARIYRNENAALAVQQGYPDTILWHGQGLLPDDTWALMGNGRLAFAPKNEIVVTHGGLTLDEMVVPLIQIKPKA